MRDEKRQHAIGRVMRGGAVALAVLFGALAAEAVAPKRFALVVGIENYPAGRLPGCLLDARSFRQTLVSSLGFDAGEVAMLLDGQATRQAMLAALEAAARRAERGDLFVFYYSGHGSVFPDRDSAEQDETRIITPIGGQGRPLPTDRYDVALVPVDAGAASSGKAWGNLILDDELYAAFSRFTARGCEAVFVSDSCFSGTLARDFAGGDAVPKYLPPDRLLPDRFQKAGSRSLEPAVVMAEKAPDLQGRYLTFGSSTDTQTSGATPDGSLFTLALNEVVRRNPRQSYRRIHAQVRELVLRVSRREQEPQLDARFFGNKIEEPFLALPAGNAPPPAARALLVEMLVTDRDNRPVPGAAIGIFPAGTPTAAGQIQAAQALITGRAGETGGFSSTASLPPGLYRVKVVHRDYRAFAGDVEIRESRSRPGRALLYVRLTPEQ